MQESCSATYGEKNVDRFVAIKFYQVLLVMSPHVVLAAHHTAQLDSELVSRGQCPTRYKKGLGHFGDNGHDIDHTHTNIITVSTHVLFSLWDMIWRFHDCLVCLNSAI